MADNIVLNQNTTTGQTVATKDVGGLQHELIIVEFVDGGGNPVEVSATDPMPVTTDGLTDTQLRATPVPISGTVTANTGLTQPLTDTQLRATPVPVSGTVTVDTSLLATAAKQDIGNTSLANIDGKITAVNTGAVVISSGTITTVAAVTSITNNVNTVEVVGATIFNGKTSTVTAGTRVTLASSQAVKSVTIKALATNTGLIYVGNSSVAAANGFQLSAGDSISMDVANLNTVNIDSSVSGEGVSYIAIGV